MRLHSLRLVVSTRAAMVRRDHVRNGQARSRHNPSLGLSRPESHMTVNPIHVVQDL